MMKQIGVAMLCGFAFLVAACTSESTDTAPTTAVEPVDADPASDEANETIALSALFEEPSRLAVPGEVMARIQAGGDRMVSADHGGLDLDAVRSVAQLGPNEVAYVAPSVDRGSLCLFVVDRQGGTAGSCAEAAAFNERGLALGHGTDRGDDYTILVFPDGTEIDELGHWQLHPPGVAVSIRDLNMDAGVVDGSLSL